MGSEILHDSILHGGSLLRGVDDSKPVERKVKKEGFLRVCLEPLCILWIWIDLGREKYGWHIMGEDAVAWVGG